ncbi:MAG: hydrolase [Verrucomicrobiales bacterium]|nr:hydrolase [Verrucomicrobiales bacterium]
MPVTQLDTRTALVAVDLQKGIISNPMAHPVEGVLKNVGELAAAFRRHGLPVVLVTVAGAPPGRVEEKRPLKQEAGWDELVPELNPQPSDHRVVKRSWGEFSGTELKEWLDSQGVTQIVLAGVSTSIG